MESAVANGFKPTDDFNGAEQEGAGPYQVTCKKGRRWSVAQAYLQPAMGRDNLTVRTGALVTRVVVEGGRAVGVAYLLGREEQVAYADARGRALRRRDQLPAAAHAVGHRAGRPPARGRRRRRARPAGRRAEPARPPRRAARLAHEGHHRPRRAQQPAATSAAPRPRAAGRWSPTSGRPARSSAAATASPHRTCRCTSRRPASGTTACTSRPPASSRSAPTLVNVSSRGQLRLRSTDPRWHPEIDPAYYDDQADLDAMVTGVAAAARDGAVGPAREVRRPAVHARAEGPDGGRDRRAHPHARPRRSTTRSAPARWAAASTRSSTRSCGCAASTACGWPTPRVMPVVAARQHQRPDDHGRREGRRPPRKPHRRKS